MEEDLTLRIISGEVELKTSDTELKSVTGELNLKAKKNPERKSEFQEILQTKYVILILSSANLKSESNH